MAETGSSLQREIRQRRPFRTKTQEAALGLLKTADLIGRMINSVLEPHGVTRQQYNVLRILRGAGEPLPTLTIRDRMIEQAPGVTRLLDRIEAKGLVTRERCPDDRRQVLCSITDAGLELLTTLDAPMDALDHDALAMLNKKELGALVDILDRIRAAHTETPED